MNTIKFLTIKLPVLLLVFMTSCGLDPDSFQPTATISGAIRDSLDLSLVEQDIENGSVIEALEDGYTSSYKWVIKNNGEYRNNFGFPNSYMIRFANCNFFPYTMNGVVVKTGDNVIDFQVVPYIRVKEPVITYDATAKKVTATFKLEAGKPVVKVKTIQLFAFSDKYVGFPIKFTINGGGDVQNINAAINPATSYTLSIDISKNLVQYKFYEGGEYYFRIGALADVANVGTVKYNYAPYVKIRL